MVLALALATTVAAGPTPTACADLKNFKLSNGTITSAEFVPTGIPAAPGRGAAPAAGRGQTGAPPAAAPAAGARGGQAPPATAGARGVQAPAAAPRGQAAGGRGTAAAPPPAPVPAHCKIVAVLKPSSDSEINVEVWLPTDNWNGKFEAVGNGGWAGSIQGTAEMQAGVRLGYATAATDTGHTGANGAFALNHPEKVIDFAYRAVHEMTVQSKVLIKEFYNQTPKYSYFNGCSTGGRQALMAAQRYPEDFDGIIAGAPANNQIYLHAGDLQRNLDIAVKNPNGLIPQAKQQMLARAALAACDGLDGMRDNLVSQPQACKYDPVVLQCKGADGPDCLTPAQVQTAQRVYMAAKTSKGELIFPGYSYGGEAAYNVMRGANPPQPNLGIDTFKYLAHQDPNWDWHTFDIDKDVALAEKNAGFINAIDPDLSKFKARGGKLLLYHGWSDPAISPENTVNYYSSVIQKMGRNQESWLRLFMVPGMGHCQGGAGPTQFDKLSVMEKWRESNSAPSQIVATNPQNGAKRPLCPYPQVAQFKGPFEPILVEVQEDDDHDIHIMYQADAADATNFACRNP